MLVHCSDGWDRTSQLSALVQVLVDPYFRSVEGFEVLIEKEFVWPGHQFAMRMACGAENAFDYSEFCPVLLQFLDCVWQVMEQFPIAFEFNELFLREIAHHSFTDRFGTFLCNCEREREKVKLRARTVSLWSYMNSQKERYRNALFNNCGNILVPDETVIRLKVWDELYMQWILEEAEGKKQLANFIKRKQEEERESILKLNEKKETLEKLKAKMKELGIAFTE